MKISYNWLKKYITTDVKPEELSEILTDTGLEVEGMEEVQSIKGGLKGVVIGKVKSCEQHPNADKLKLTTVDVGEHDLLHIVCGAPNVAKNQTVLVATIGTMIYSDQGDFEIKKSKIRGAVSEGMLCAEDELGLGKGHDGIMVLEDDIAPGTEAATHFGIESDYVLEIGLTPNRTDAMCHYGVARDLHAYMLRHNRRSTLSFPDLAKFQEGSDIDFKLELKNPEACKRYIGLRLSNLKVDESPSWLQNSLKAIGLSPINNVVDITNFVMHEMGQPLHAFDFSKITDQTIRVETLADQTAFTSLDEQERKLSDKDLMICDGADKPMCIAGVFGGIDSGISSSSTEVFLESACFDSVWVRKTAKRHGLNTDASFRFERGVAEDISLAAIKRAALLMQEICGAEISSRIVDEYPKPSALNRVKFKLSRLNMLAGQDIDASLVKTILKGLEIDILAEESEEWTLEIPAYRVDVLREADVLEEILRIYGYNEIRLSGRINASITRKPAFDLEQKQEDISNFLAANGFMEAMSNSLTKANYIDGWSNWKEEQFVKILNPLSSDLAVLRQTILFNGLEAIAYNQNRRREELKIFEFGNVYHMFGEKKVEQKHLDIFLAGSALSETWINSDKENDFFRLKSLVVNLLANMGIASFQEKLIDLEYADSAVQLHLGKNKLAEISILNEKLKKSFDIKLPVFYAHINWSLLCDLSSKKQLKFQPISKFPAVRRDLAMLISKELPFEQLKQTAFKTEKKLLQEVSLFDVYEGKGIDASKKSYAMSFVLQAAESTLSDKQIDKVMRKIQSAFEREHGAELRS